MTVIVGSGALDEYCTIAETAMRALGIRAAQPTRRTEYTPTELSQRLSLGSDKTARSGIREGGAWKTVGAEIIVSNALRSPWGWASPRALYTVDFWSDLEQDTGFLFVYEDPSGYLTRAGLRGGARGSDYADLLDQWKAYHRRMLQVIELRRSRTALISVNAFGVAGNEVQEALEGKFGFPTSAAVLGSQEIAAPNRLERMLAERFVDDDANELLRALCKAADVAPKIEVSQVSNEGLLDDYARMKQGGLAFAGVGPEAREKETKEPEMGLPPMEAEVSVLRRQLEQANEELRYYFLESQKAKGAGQGRVAGQKPSEAIPLTRYNSNSPSLLIDLRSYIEGENWHNAEIDGRWGGPGTTSVLRGSSLRAGRYRFELMVVDAISAEILAGMAVKVNGVPVRGLKSVRAETGGRLGRVRAALDAVRSPSTWPFPRLVTGQVDLPQAADDKGTILELIMPEAKSPADRGELDDRMLTLRIRSAALIASA